ncbi:alcohol dehydrogenase catalytic domain-containing protein [Streptomyces thermocarboxydus]
MGGSPPIAPRSTASGDTGTTPLPQAARASVALPGARSELRTFPLRAAGPREGWLRVTASGICGTDVGLFHRGVAAETVLGHHVVGRIAAVGPEAAHRWQVGPGDRVVVEEYLPCGECPAARPAPTACARRPTCGAAAGGSARCRTRTPRSSAAMPSTCSSRRTPSCTGCPSGCRRSWRPGSCRTPTPLTGSCGPAGSRPGRTSSCSAPATTASP